MLMTFEQALAFFGIVCAVLVFGLIICFGFNKHISSKNFYGFYCSWAAAILVVALILTATSVMTNTTGIRKTECRSKVAPVLAELDLAARDYESALRSICV
jgi:uncharacterized membrane protein